MNRYDRALDLQPTLARSIEPAAEPVSLDELKAQLRIDHADEDDLLGELIAAARECVEDDTARALVTQTWQLTLDRFPRGCASSADYRVIELRRPPVQSVTSVTYYDADAVEQTLDPSAYHVSTAGAPGRLVLADGESWPVTECGRPGAVTVTFACGYGADGSAVPAAAKHAIKLLCGHWYRNREAVGSVGKEVAKSYDWLAAKLRWSLIAKACP